MRTLKAAALTVVALGLVAAAVSLKAANSTPVSVFKGTVKSATGEALAGVPVSVRPEGKTFTQTVFTDEKGAFYFPPFAAPFEPGKYQVWSQAVGFGMERSEIQLMPGHSMGRDFVLKKIDDFTNQLSGTEWMDALPDATREDRRMKEIFRVNCIECHQPGLVLQNRFDEQGWTAILNLMEKVSYHGFSGVATPPRTTIAYHKKELAQYLSRVRGPASSPLKFKLMPRPTGDAARVVITEYDIPTAVGKAERAVNDGSNWVEGIVAGMHGQGGMHDVQIDDAGNAWLTDSEANDYRTVVKLDPRTGQVKGFKVTAPNGRAQTSHGIARDHNGIIWFDTGGMLARLDPRTETFEFYRPTLSSPTTTSGQVDVAPNGRVWMSARRGALMFDPATKAFRFFQDKTIGDGQTYGAATDAQGNGWWTQFNMDNVVHHDVAANQTYDIPMRPPDRMEVVLTPDDRDFYHNIGGDRFSGTFARPGAQAPRRLSVDRASNTVWVANWWGANLAKIDVKTRKVTYIKVPFNSNPYNTIVDKNHMVWTNLTTDDAVGKFDPKTEKWTIYKLPSIGAELRHIAVDDKLGEVWVPYRESDRAARLQFRSEAQLAELRGEAPASRAAR
jgi:virginiamycin B lyase